MKAKKKILTAATLSAFLALAGAVQAHNTSGDKGAARTYTGKKGHRHARSGKAHKLRRRRKRNSGGTTTPPPK
jgi:hypothetical protein